jgi:threonine aldolase
MSDDQGGEHNFASDNVSAVCPEIMAAIVNANVGSVGSYGSDPLTARLTERLKEVFETDLVAIPVATGTAANALALSVLTPPYGSVLCAESAHINTDECGAPEFYMGGAKLLGLPAPAGKLSADSVELAIAQARAGGLQSAQPHAISLTQSTEWGTVYSRQELASISAIAAKNDIAVHMDGSRLANGLVRLGCSPAEMTWKSGIDVLSFGATKNGAMAAEMVIFFDCDRAAGLAARHKRAGHLWSKSRFLSAQLLAYLTDDLWLRNAGNANVSATYLAEGLLKIEGVCLLQPVEANEVFVILPEPVSTRLRHRGLGFAAWRRGNLFNQNAFRFVTSYSTRTSDIDRLLNSA